MEESGQTACMEGRAEAWETKTSVEIKALKRIPKKRFFLLILVDWKKIPDSHSKSVNKYTYMNYIWIFKMFEN